jgi:hypothetical protein
MDTSNMGDNETENIYASLINSRVEETDPG